jgi:hypothetical protein
MTLTTVTHVSVDGVMQGLGARDEDRRGGFERASSSAGCSRTCFHVYQPTGRPQDAAD